MKYIERGNNGWPGCVKEVSLLRFFVSSFWRPAVELCLWVNRLVYSVLSCCPDTISHWFLAAGS